MQGDYYINPFSNMSGLTPFEKSIHIAAIQVRLGIFNVDYHRWVMYLKENQSFSYMGIEDPFGYVSWKNVWRNLK